MILKFPKMGKICMVNIYKYIWTFLPELIRKNFNQLNLLGNVIKIYYLFVQSFLYYIKYITKGSAKDGKTIC